jgi:hypothetical protein
MLVKILVKGLDNAKKPIFQMLKEVNFLKRHTIDGGRDGFVVEEQSKANTEEYLRLKSSALIQQS